MGAPPENTKVSIFHQKQARQIHTFVTKVHGKEQSTARCASSVQSRSGILDGILGSQRQERRNTKEQERETVEKPRQRKRVQSREPTEHKPPQRRSYGVRASHDVELLLGLSGLSNQQDDLVRVGRHDLTKGKDKRVDRPVAETNRQKLLETRRWLVPIAEQELVVAIRPARLVVIVVLVIRRRNALDAHHARDPRLSFIACWVRATSAAQFRVAEVLGPLLLALLEVVINAKIRV